MKFRILRDQWFLVGMAIVTSLTLWNPSQLSETAGPFLKNIHALEWGLALVFILSGLEMQIGHVQDALRDWKGICLSILSTFLLAPLLAWILSHATHSHGIALGLFIIGVVSTTQASGIVMSAAAGGRAAHALIICLLSNLLCIFTIPTQLNWMTGQQDLHIQLPWLATTLKLGSLILLPLIIGMILRAIIFRFIDKLPFKPNVFSRLIILVFIFIGLCDGRTSILNRGNDTLLALLFALILHLALAGILWALLRWMSYGKGKRESVFFMGIQKTLPQAIWLQTTYFPTYGMALVVCILYHIVQLVIDSYLVARLSKK